MIFLNFSFWYLIVNRWRLRYKLWRIGLRKMFVDKDKFILKKDIWLSFYVGLLFIFIKERVNFFSFFVFVIKKFVNVFVIKRNFKKVGYQGIFLKNVVVLNKYIVMDWVIMKLVFGILDNIFIKDEVWDCFKINYGISDEQYRERFFVFFGIVVVGYGLFLFVSIKKKKIFVGLKVNEFSEDKCLV